METNIKSQKEYLPPPEAPGVIKWIKDNLFGSLLNSILSVLSLAIIYFMVVGAANWILFTADWSPITEGPLLYVIGQYPREDMWRVGIALSLVVLMIGISWGKWGGLIKSISFAVMIIFLIAALLPVSHPQLSVGMRLYLAGNIVVALVGFLIGRIKGLKTQVIAAAWLLTPILVVVLFSGFEGSEGFRKIATTSWGGLMVTFLLAVGGILLSFPLGVILALGRRSKLPVVKAFATIYIETIRGVPLITILFMFSIILALFLPQETRLDRLLRALMAMIVFSSAYTAENVRGGLQAVPQGQIEAAKALGMNSFKIMGLIVLPQAIRAVIPAIVGQFISLFKDTTLVVIIGINDLLGIGKSIINSSPEFVQLQTEVYIFIAVIYWAFSYLMSLASRRIEGALGVGER
ncbi:MAG: amino acid ABC transporter permease [Chloroflexota bacterium]